MEQFISGYCRALDQSRMVEVEKGEGMPAEADCDYPACPHVASCEIAKRIREVANGSNL